jgi:hypothetical protein
MGTAVTTIPQLTSDNFAARIAANFPPGWSSPQAKLPGGVLYAVLETIGAEFAFEISAETYALAATRLQTAINGALDLASLDFFGSGLYALPRLPGETDAAFSGRLLAAMLTPTATRPAIFNAVENASGFPPRLIESWRTVDTGVWNCPNLAALSYWDVDTIPNPFRWTTGTNPNAASSDLGLEYQGFVECVLPTTEPFGNNPTPCWDEYTFTWNVYENNTAASGAFIDAPTTTPLGETAIYNVINRTKAEGTTVWVKFVAPPVAVSWDQAGAKWDTPGLTWDS